VPEDIFKPFDILTQFAPHNVVAGLLGGGQVIGISSGGLSSSMAQESQGQKGQGPGAGPAPSSQPGGGTTSKTAAASGATTEGTTEKTNGGTTGGTILVAGGPTYGGMGSRGRADAAGGRGDELKIPQQIKFKVTDKETKLAIPDAAISYDDGTILGATDYRGEFKTSDIPQGNHLVAIDAMGYDLYEQEVYVSPPAFNVPPKDYKIELSFLGELPGLGEGEPYTPPTEPYTPPTEPYTPPTGGYEGGGGGYGGGGYGGGGAPSYEAPSYQAPSYGAPSYGGPSYQQPPPQTAPQAPSGLPLPPIEYLQQFFLLPFTTLQSVFSTPPPAPGPLPKGGQIAVYGKPRREILGYCPAEVIGKTVIY